VRPRITYANVAATVALVLAASGFAMAANPGSDGVVKGCLSKGSRVLSVPKSGKCANGEKKLSWNQKGPRGFTGKDGASGMSAYEIKAGDPGESSGASLVANSTATCPTGKKVVGGGSSTDATTRIDTNFSKPFGENQWIVQTTRDSAGAYTLTAYAICVKVAG
jgi:hypothetical protein